MKKVVSAAVLTLGLLAFTGGAASAHTITTPSPGGIVIEFTPEDFPNGSGGSGDAPGAKAPGMWNGHANTASDVLDL